MLFPAQFVETHGVIEAAQRDLAAVGEQEAFAGRQLSDYVGQQDLPTLRLIGDPSGLNDGGAEEVVVLHDGLAGAEAAADIMAETLGWDADRRSRELAEYRELAAEHTLPPLPPLSD